MNAYTTSDQRCPDVAARPDGSFVVVWDSLGSSGTDDSGSSVQARLMGPGGEPLGGEFQVNEVTTGFQLLASVEAMPTGGFLVAWNRRVSFGPLPEGFDVAARRFASDGTAIGLEFLVNAYTTDNQRDPRIVVADDSSFVVAWDGPPDGSYNGIHARAFDPVAEPIGPDVLLNESTIGFQNGAALAPLDDHGFVAAWHSDPTGAGNLDALARVLGPDLSPATGEILLSAPASTASFPVLLGRSAGRFIAVWEAGFPDPLQARRLTSSGLSLDPAFDVSSHPVGDKARPETAAGASGDFVVVWETGNPYAPEESPDGDVYAVSARFFGDGGPISEELVVNSYTPSAQNEPAVAVGLDGRVLVVWQSFGGPGDDTDGYSIQSRFLESPAIFFDGFESGDTARWSVPGQ